MQQNNVVGSLTPHITSSKGLLEAMGDFGDFTDNVATQVSTTKGANDALSDFNKKVGDPDNFDADVVEGEHVDKRDGFMAMFNNEANSYKKTMDQLLTVEATDAFKQHVADVQNNYRQDPVTANNKIKEFSDGLLKHIKLDPVQHENLSLSFEENRNKVINAMTFDNHTLNMAANTKMATDAIATRNEDIKALTKRLHSDEAVDVKVRGSIQNELNKITAERDSLIDSLLDPSNSNAFNLSPAKIEELRQAHQFHIEEHKELGTFYEKLKQIKTTITHPTVSYDSEGRMTSQSTKYVSMSEAALKEANTWYKSYKGNLNQEQKDTIYHEMLNEVNATKQEERRSWHRAKKKKVESVNYVDSLVKSFRVLSVNNQDVLEYIGAKKKKDGSIDMSRIDTVKYGNILANNLINENNLLYASDEEIQKAINDFRTKNPYGKLLNDPNVDSQKRSTAQAMYRQLVEFQNNRDKKVPEITESNKLNKEDTTPTQVEIINHNTDTFLNTGKNKVDILPKVAVGHFNDSFGNPNGDYAQGYKEFNEGLLRVGATTQDKQRALKQLTPTAQSVYMLIDNGLGHLAPTATSAANVKTPPEIMRYTRDKIREAHPGLNEDAIDAYALMVDRVAAGTGTLTFNDSKQKDAVDAVDAVIPQVVSRPLKVGGFLGINQDSIERPPLKNGEIAEEVDKKFKADLIYVKDELGVDVENFKLDPTTGKYYFYNSDSNRIVRSPLGTIVYWTPGHNDTFTDKAGNVYTADQLSYAIHE